MCVRGGEMLEENGRYYMLVSSTVCFMTEKLFFKNALKMFALLVYWKLNDVLTEEATI